MRVVGLIDYLMNESCWEEDSENFFALFAATLQVSTYGISPANIAHMGLAWESNMQAMVLIGNAKQALSVGKRKSGPGETGLITRNYDSAQFGTLGNYPISFCVRLSNSSLTSLATLAFTDEGCGTNRLLDERKLLGGRLRDFFALFAAILQVSLDWRLWPCYYLASFPGLPQLHSLIYSSTVSKLNWRLVRPGNKANYYLLV